MKLSGPAELATALGALVFGLWAFRSDPRPTAARTENRSTPIGSDSQQPNTRKVSQPGATTQAATPRFATGAPALLTKTAWERMRAGDVEPKDILAEEPRDQVWAPAMEQRLTRRLSDHIQSLPGANIQEITCKTSICRVKAETGGNVDVLPSAIDGVHMSAGYLTTGHKDPMHAESYYAFAEWNRDPEAYDAWVNRIAERVAKAKNR